MTNCNQIKRLIDETEQPEVMPFEATHHLNACTSCRMFADERAGLRALLNGIPRVNAPINFDAQLKARINTAKAKPAFSWLSPALYLRFGAATAALLLAVFVAQYNGLFSLVNQSAGTANMPVAVITPVPLPGITVKTFDDVKRATPDTKGKVEIATLSNKVIHKAPSIPVKAVDNSMPAEDLLFRASSERDVKMNMLSVSLGAQQNMNRVDAKQKLVSRSGRTSGRSSERALVQQPVALNTDTVF